jgi:hypothetical protein
VEQLPDPETVICHHLHLSSALGPAEERRAVRRVEVGPYFWRRDLEELCNEQAFPDLKVVRSPDSASLRHSILIPLSFDALDVPTCWVRRLRKRGVNVIDRNGLIIIVEAQPMV